MKKKEGKNTYFLVNKSQNGKDVFLRNLPVPINLPPAPPHLHAMTATLVAASAGVYNVKVIVEYPAVHCFAKFSY